MRPVVQVIMPIGSDPDYRAKQQAIERGARAAGLYARFPQYDPAYRKFDVAEAVARLREAAIVLADLTAARPSCYYELGLAEAVGRPVRLVAALGTEVHQTGGREGVHYYSTLNELEKVAAELLRFPQETS